MSEKTYVIHQNNPDDYRIINQNGVKQALTAEPLHNACWDANLAPDGTLYFSVCSELTTHEFAKLYKYDFDTNAVTECFYTKDYLLKSDRYIRDSKFHTSINFKPDGKLIMVTHTTDKAPQHIAWLPLSFVSNPFEGFPGAELMEYDPKAGIAYGVGGDKDDVGNLFSYSEKEGLRYLGVTICDRADDTIGTCASFYPTCCAISPRGEKVAVGVGDRLSCVYIYTKPYFK